MWFLKLIIVCLVVWSSVNVQAGAVGKITVDPNASKAKVTANTPENGTRLGQKVTYEAKRKTVSSILADLSDLTGITLKAGYNNQDWQVRDRKMNIFAKDIPLNDIMNSIARVMKFKWSKSENADAPIYRLYMDKKTLLGAERERFIEEERIKKCQTEKRQKLLSGLDAATEMSDDDLENLKNQSPYIYDFTKNGSGRLLQKLCAEVPAARNAWLSGEEYTIGFGSLSSDMQQKLRDTFSSTAVDGSITTICNNKTTSSIIANLEVKISTAPSSFQSIWCNVLDPNSKYANLRARLFNATNDSEADQINKDINTLLSSEAKDNSEPRVEHPDDFALSAKIKINAEGYKFADILASLSESSGFAIVSDSFDAKFYGLNFPKDEIKVQKALDKIESVCKYNWERNNSILEFYDKDWFRKRAYQIPEAWLEVWRKSLKDKGILDINQLSQIAILTPEQISANIYDDDILGQAVGLDCYGISVNRDILNAYAALNKQQQNLIFTKQGLNLDLLVDNESSEVQALLQRCTSLQRASQGGLRLVGTIDKYEKQTIYLLNIMTSSGDYAGLQWTIHTPVYTPPVEKQPKDAKSKQT